MKEKDEIMIKAFANILMLMINNDTDNIQLTFKYSKCKARFKVELLDLQDTEYQQEEGE